MKRLSFLLVAVALTAFVSLNSCKTSVDPSAIEDMVEGAVEEAAEAVEAAVEEAEVVADSTVATEEEVVEEAAE